MNGRASAHCMLEVSRTFSKGEIAGSVSRIGISFEDDASVNHMVEGRPKVCNGIPDNERVIAEGDRLRQSEFVDCVSWLRICFNDYSVRVPDKKLCDPSIEILNVMLCPSDLLACTD